MGFLDRLLGRSQERGSGSERAISVTSESPEAAPFEKVQEGGELLAAGDIEKAERAFLDGVGMYRRIGDTDGVAYALGRLGNFYHKTQRADEALAAYQEAVGTGTDIPAIYEDLMNILAERSQSEQLFRVAEEYYRCSRAGHEQILALLIRLASTRAPGPDVGEQWLLRVERWAEDVGDSSARFAAWGRRAHFYEEAGDISRAIASYEEGVAAGSSDRFTYTRLLMAYEKAKRWDDLFRVAEHGLTVQHDAAWEQDLRKHIERGRRKSGVAPKGARQTIPAFSVRHGADKVRLIAQIDLSPPAAKLAVSADESRVLVSGASSKEGNLILYDLRARIVSWRATVGGASADILVLRDKYVAVTQQGRIGDGSAHISLFDANGRLETSLSIPDKLTEVRVAGEQLVAGCRDGHLYCYNIAGKLRWSYRVPRRADVDGSDPYQRPCPYFVTVSPDGERILFSSWDEVFMLDAYGKVLWKWRTVTKERKFRYTVPLDEERPTEEYYRVLGIAPAAPDEDVRRAFRRRAFETHPDHHPEDPTGEKFKAVLQAYEAIMSGVAVQSAEASVTIEISMSSGLNTIYGLAVGPKGQVSAVTSSDGHLAFLDSSGRLVHTLVCGDGMGTVSASRELKRIVYAHWGGLNFYDEHGLVNLYPADMLYRVAVREDGGRVAAWQKQNLLVFDGEGHLISEIEFAKSIGDLAFLADDELLVAAGKLIRLALA